jgi:hypothetical protein
MTFERIVLEEDPDFDVQKEYEEELVYYYQQHPEDKGYVPPKSFKETATGFLGKARETLDKVVEIRDHAYGYDKPDDGKSHIRLKPVDDMNFLPGGMAGMGGQDLGGFGFGGGNMSANPFEFPSGTWPEENTHQHKGQPKVVYKTVIKKAKKTEKKKPKKVIRIKRDEPSDGGFDVMNADPFGVRKKR